MSVNLLDENVKKLMGAYRHPFEYISPNLYMKEDSKVKEMVYSR
jgi:hypothetical protein